jgi:RimJ/RimL family protein N-acetyltransferase
MSFHKGKLYTRSDVSIGSPDVEAIRHAAKAPDIATAVWHWLASAAESNDMYYFSVFSHETLVGEIFLHDIDQDSKTSLVGYHLFEPSNRGRGIGTKALSLLQQFVIEDTDLTRLIIITSRDNIASQRIAQKCGFANGGVPREDPENGVLFQWDIPARGE